MDWFVHATPQAVSLLRRELARYLARHAEPGSDVDGAVLVASELLTNALQNSERPFWVSVDWGSIRPVLSVHDAGPGFELSDIDEPDVTDVEGRGLMIASRLVDQLSVTRRDAGGSVVQAVLPVLRSPSEDIDPAPSQSLDSLPHPDEARDDGTFGRESFLRALVLQLARHLEMTSGPAAAQAMVAQVGTDVGVRMEDAYRAANGWEGPLDVGRMSELFVALKHAIDGDFSVLEQHDDRIVLGNRRCPFGDDVKHAPSLCRMTSSVFGGIARRNHGVAAVDLEQRIAIGDPTCRVTVWLKPPGEERRSFVHVYGSPPDDSPDPR